MLNTKNLFLLFFIFSNQIHCSYRTKVKLDKYNFRGIELSLPKTLTESIGYMKSGIRKFYMDNRMLLVGSSQNTNYISNLIAKELSSEIFIVDGLELVTLYKYSSAQYLFKIFNQAFSANKKSNKKVTIIFKNMDSIVTKKISKENNLTNIALCSYLDDIEKNFDIQVIITCSEKSLNENIFSRFDLHIFPIENLKGRCRKNLIADFLKDLKLEATDKELIEFAKASKFLTIDEIRNCINDAVYAGDYKSILLQHLKRKKYENYLKLRRE